MPKQASMPAWWSEGGTSTSTSTAAPPATTAAGSVPPSDLLDLSLLIGVDKHGFAHPAGWRQIRADPELPFHALAPAVATPEVTDCEASHSLTETSKEACDTAAVTLVRNKATDAATQEATRGATQGGTAAIPTSSSAASRPTREWPEDKALQARVAWLITTGVVYAKRMRSSANVMGMMTTSGTASSIPSSVWQRDQKQQQHKQKVQQDQQQKGLGAAAGQNKKLVAKRPATAGLASFFNKKLATGSAAPAPAPAPGNGTCSEAIDLSSGSAKENSQRTVDNGNAPSAKQAKSVQPTKKGGALWDMFQRKPKVSTNSTAAQAAVAPPSTNTPSPGLTTAENKCTTGTHESTERSTFAAENKTEGCNGTLNNVRPKISPQDQGKCTTTDVTSSPSKGQTLPSSTSNQQEKDASVAEAVPGKRKVVEQSEVLQKQLAKKPKLGIGSFFKARTPIGAHCDQK